MIEKDLVLFNELVELLLEDELVNPVVEPTPPEDVVDVFDLGLSEFGSSEESFRKILKNLALQTPKTASKRFFNQLFGGRQGKAILGDLLSVMLNNSMYTYKVAGPQVGVEKEVLAECAKMIGYDSNFGGTFPAGGSMSNFMAMIMARDHFNKRIKHDGVAQKLIAYASEISHYSNKKNASFAGIGRNNVRIISCNDRGEMIPSELDKMIQEDLSKGYSPFYVTATAGTTVVGSYDDIEALRKVTDKYNIWLHVDGAYGGAAFFSKKYKHLLNGVEKADSFSFNAHKMLGTPLTCSLLFAKDKKDLTYSFDNAADYLYQTSDDDYNLGKTSLQCGRRNDALKFWTLWKSIGTAGLREIVDQLFHLANTARNYVDQHPDYQLYTFEDSLSIGFNYKGIDPRLLCSDLYESGELMVGYGQFKDEEFVRLISVNANFEDQDYLNFFSILEKHVEQNSERFVNISSLKS